MFDGEPGSYEVCPICFWEDDAAQLADPTSSGGANRPSLAEAQASFERCRAIEDGFVHYVREPLPGEERDSTWRPLQPSDLEGAGDVVDPAGGQRRVDPVYYWRRGE